ncbi:MAG: DUF5723 family protein [Bacteroidia bacterium]|nr:DUF5723 family protein [Bacteroidia bacterium]
MIGKTKYILILLLAMIIADASAQNSQVLYYMNLPQNHLINPALRPSNKLYIGLPAITGINVNINNNFVNFSDVFMKGQSSDSIISFLHPDYNVDDFLNKIKVKNSLEPEVTVQLFGLGFTAWKNSYFFLDINDRVDGNVVLPGDLFKLALKGNEGFVGSKIDLSSLRGDLKYYREIGLGFSRNFTNKLRIGVKGKLLFGIAGASIKNRSLGITVNDNYAHALDADLIVNISAPLNVYMDADHNIDSIVFDDKRFESGSGIADFILGKKNMGLGLDIGATYDISDKLMVSAAITDIGYIRWKKDVTNIKAKSQFEFSGFDMLDVINGTKTFEELGKEMVDSLKNSFIVSDSKVPFTTFLPFGVTLGGRYNLTRRFSLGLLSYSRVIGKQLRESMTLSANVNIGNSLSTSLSYTVANHRFDNLGAGVAFRAGIFQFYLLTDRIPVMWNKIKVDSKSTITLPKSWNTVNLRLGLNLSFGNRISKKDDKPMVLVE